MNRKSSIVILLIIIAAAILLGLLLVNKGDGPVMGMIISDTALQSTDDYKARESSPGAGDYLIYTKEYNKFKVRNVSDIPAGKDIFANVHFVECPKGAEFTAKWSIGSTIVKEETKKLSTDQQGVLSYLLESSKISKGKCQIQIFSDNEKIYECTF